MNSDTHIRIYIYIYACISMYMYMYRHINICIHNYAYIFNHEYVFGYMYIVTHLLAYTHVGMIKVCAYMGRVMQRHMGAQFRLSDCRCSPNCQAEAPLPLAFSMFGRQRL